MKKLFLLTVVFTIVITANAQISAGLKAGLNLSTFGGDSANIKIQPGFHLGGYMNIGLNEKLSFQPELLISTAGAKIERKGSGFSLESTNKLTYLSIPLSLQYSFGSFNVHVGPQVSFLMSAKTEYNSAQTDGYGNTIVHQGKRDTKKDFSDIDFGLNFGAGINLGKLGISARYSLGMTNTSDPEEGIYVIDKWTNNVIQVSAMYRFFGN